MAFRAKSKLFAKHSAVLIGASPDTVEKHQKFKQKYDLDFALVADTEHALAEKYGAWREKTMYGKKKLGIQRSTYLIGRDGKVAKVWKAVKVVGHDEKVLEALGELA